MNWGTNFWLPVRTDLQKNSSEGSLFGSVDGLGGHFQCHRLYLSRLGSLAAHRASDQKLNVLLGLEESQGTFLVDLKRVCCANSLGEAEVALDELEAL